MRDRRLLFGCAVLTGLLTLVATLAAAAPKQGGTLRVAYGNEIANLDFHTAPGYEMMWVAMTAPESMPLQSNSASTASRTPRPNPA